MQGTPVPSAKGRPTTRFPDFDQVLARLEKDGAEARRKPLDPVDEGPASGVDRIPQHHFNIHQNHLGIDSSQERNQNEGQPYSDWKSRAKFTSALIYLRRKIGCAINRLRALARSVTSKPHLRGSYATADTETNGSERSRGVVPEIRQTANSVPPVLEPEILAPVIVAERRSNLPTVSPGREAFARFLSSLDPSLKGDTQDVLRAIGTVSLSIEFTNGRSISFQSKRSNVAELSDILSVDRKRWTLRALPSIFCAIILAAVAVLIATRMESPRWSEPGQRRVAAATTEPASAQPSRLQVQITNKSVITAQNKDRATTIGDIITPEAAESVRAKGGFRFDIGEVGPKEANNSLTAAPRETAALNLSPKATDLANAQQLLKKGDVTGAIAGLSRAIIVNPKSAAAYWNRGLAYAYRSENDKAISDLTRAIEFGKAPPNQLSSVDLFSIHRSRALLYDLKGLHSREIADLTDMINMYWSDPATAEALNQVWTPTRAKALIASAHRLRGAAYAQISATDKALTDLAVAIELDPQHAAEAYNQRGQMREKLGDRVQAIADYRSALRLDPNIKEARVSLTRMGFGY